MKLKILSIIFIVTNIYGAPNLLFKSSFEDGVYLEKPDRKDSTIWWQNIKGSDNNDFEWPITLNDEKGEFQMIINDQNITEYIQNSLVVVKGIDNNKSRVLHQKIMKKEHRWSQDPYVIHTNDKEQKRLYLRYSLKYPIDLAERLGKDGWLTFCQYKTATDYRLTYYIYTDKNKKLYWYVHEDNVVVDGAPYKEYWYQENYSQVKQGEWFDVEIYWNRSKNKKEGRVWLAIDGKVVIDYKGQTMLEEPINQMMLFTNYAVAPIEQWVDNVEIWDDFPCGEGKSCHEEENQKIKEKENK